MGKKSKTQAGKKNKKHKKKDAEMVPPLNRKAKDAPRRAAREEPSPAPVGAAEQAQPAPNVFATAADEKAQPAAAEAVAVDASTSDLIERATTQRMAPDPAPVSRETLPRPARTRTLVVANQKGGVGKTTTVVNIAVALANGGNRVLVLDLDPQGNASTALGIPHQPGTPGTYEVLLNGDAIAEHAQPSPEAENLYVLPSSVDLAAAEIQLVSTVARESRLQRALQNYLREHPTDYIFLDCPPSLGLLTLNALVAASEIMIPIQCEYYALEGVSQLMNTISLVKGQLNDDLALSTVLLTMYDARTLLSSQVADEVRNAFPEQTLRAVIPRSVRIAEAPSYGQTVVTYDPRSAGAEAYLNAAREIAERGANKESE